MEKRYQVFVSSTYEDLKDERRAVLEALLRLNAIPSGMELFPATDDDAWALIQRMIQECDYYLLIIGGRYGSTDADGLGFTEKEYDYAVTIGKPVLCFLHGDPSKIEAGKTEESSRGRKRLDDFRNKVRDAKHVQTWVNGPEDLRGQVAFSFPDLVRRKEAIGWVRANEVIAGDAGVEMARMQKEITSLKEDLRRATREAPSGAERYSQGEDLVETVADYSFHLGRQVEDVEGRMLSGTLVFTEDQQWTWDTLFQALAPRMLAPCTYETLKSALEAELHDALGWASLNRMLLSQGIEPRDASPKLTSKSVARRSMDEITVQFMALGLIEQVATEGHDRLGTVWKLTPHGIDKLMQLTALKR